MNKKKILWFKLSISLLSLLPLYFAWDAIHQLREYSRLEERASLSSINWSVHSTEGQAFTVTADYTFAFQDKEILGKSALGSHSYPNSWSAGQAIRELSQKEWQIWFDPLKPEISSLEKEFPLKSCIYAVLVFAIWLYFSFVLRYKVLSLEEELSSK